MTRTELETKVAEAIDPRITHGCSCGQPDGHCDKQRFCDCQCQGCPVYVASTVHDARAAICVCFEAAAEMVAKAGWHDPTGCDNPYGHTSCTRIVESAKMARRLRAVFDTKPEDEQ